MPITIDGDGGISGLDLSDFGDVSGTPTDGQFLAWNSSTSKWEPTTMSVKEKKIAAFTASGTWTVPAGVTYAIAHCLGGGGGTSADATATAGGDSSVVLNTLTVTSPGGLEGNGTGDGNSFQSESAPSNSGMGARGWYTGVGRSGVQNSGYYSQWITGGDAVTPAASVTVTVGSGGTGSATGGSGYVYIEYYE